MFLFFIIPIDSEVPYSSVSNITWRQGRQLLRQYLQEIGYTDTIIDVRSNRVRSLLSLNNNTEQEENVSPNVNGNENNLRARENQGKRIYIQQYCQYNANVQRKISVFFSISTLDFVLV